MACAPPGPPCLHPSRVIGPRPELLHPPTPPTPENAHHPPRTRGPHTLSCPITDTTPHFQCTTRLQECKEFLTLASQSAALTDYPDPRTPRPGKPCSPPVSTPAPTPPTRYTAIGAARALRATGAQLTLRDQPIHPRRLHRDSPSEFSPSIRSNTHEQHAAPCRSRDPHPRPFRGPCSRGRLPRSRSRSRQAARRHRLGCSRPAAPCSSKRGQPARSSPSSKTSARMDHLISSSVQTPSALLDDEHDFSIQRDTWQP